MATDAQKASYLVNAAVREGRLQRQDTCELCGCSQQTYAAVWRFFGINRSPTLVGHHWNGYDHPLDVWWVCRRCNSALVGRHDGSLTIEQAREIVKPFSAKYEFRAACQIAVTVASKYPDMDGYGRMKEIGDWILANMSPDGRVSFKDLCAHFATQNPQ